MGNKRSSIINSLVISTITFVVGSTFIPASADACKPNDPDGANPGNLCLTFPTSFSDPDAPWSPLPDRPINQPPFIQGTGQEAYYGLRVSPTQPGRVVGSTTGYWTNIEAINGFTSITDSNNNTIEVK